MTRALVTGAPRSGTAYVAALIRECGREAHHEQVFTPDGVSLKSWTGVEVSWMGAPYRSRSWLREIPIFHLTRHPEAVFRSLIHNNFAWFEFVDDMIEWRRFILHHAPEVSWPTDWCERLLDLIETWNGFLEGVPVVHVEDPASLAEALGLDVEKAEAASAALGTQVNHWIPTPPVSVSPDIAARLASLAAAWGYATDLDPEPHPA